METSTSQIPNMMIRTQLGKQTLTILRKVIQGLEGNQNIERAVTVGPPVLAQRHQDLIPFTVEDIETWDKK
eukprot:scaffold73838_cov48-Cyclotella_meneghiniana.AAC.1